MKALDGFLSVLALSTRLPVPYGKVPEYRSFALHFPLVGILVSTLLYASWSLFSILFRDSGVATFCSLVVQFFAFDLFHFDGLLDSADALLVYASREKRLAILKDPHSGSFATFAGAIYLSGLWLAFSRALDLSGVMLYQAFLFPVAGRLCAVCVPLMLRPARPDGLGAALAPYSRPKSIASLIGFGLAIGAFVPALSLAGRASLDVALFVRPIAALSFSLAASCLIAILPYARKIGGFTGDTMGLAVEIGGLAYLVALIAFPGF